jgi:hypothetical protein
MTLSPPKTVALSLSKSVSLRDVLRQAQHYGFYSMNQSNVIPLKGMPKS